LRPLLSIPNVLDIAVDFFLLRPREEPRIGGAGGMIARDLLFRANFASVPVLGSDLTDGVAVLACVWTLWVDVEAAVAVLEAVPAPGFVLVDVALVLVEVVLDPVAVWAFAAQAAEAARTESANTKVGDFMDGPMLRWNRRPTSERLRLCCTREAGTTMP
jgi:hypothetical protein